MMFDLLRPALLLCGLFAWSLVPGASGFSLAFNQKYLLAASPSLDMGEKAFLSVKGGPNPVNTVTDCFQYNMEYAGNEISNVKAQNPSSCQTKCRDNLDCIFFTFNEKEKVCHLKNAKGRESMNTSPDNVSGPRYCTGWSDDYKSYSIPTNSAQSGTASQSSTYWHGSPSNAIDGNRDTNFVHKSCSHTRLGTEKAWLQVDLLLEIQVEAVILVNRGDCCGDRLANFQILVDDKICVEQIDAIAQGATVELFCDKPVTGSSVRIERRVKTKSLPLTLCEVEIRGRRPPAGSSDDYKSNGNYDTVAFPL